MKNKILELYRRHQFTRFGEHNELLAMVVSGDCFCDDNGYQEFDELIFAVEKDWLLNYMNQDRFEWDVEKLKEWLREEYTSEDSYEIFYAAIEDNEIVMLEFN